jgi:hypothetical protein
MDKRRKLWLGALTLLSAMQYPIRERQKALWRFVPEKLGFGYSRYERM